jgi:hypothetical protein
LGATPNIPVMIALEPTNEDSEQMMVTLTGFWLTQIAGAVATHLIADHLAEGPATAGQISRMEGIDATGAFRLLRASASLGLASFGGLAFSATPLLSTLRQNVPGDGGGAA